MTLPYDATKLDLSNIENAANLGLLNQAIWRAIVSLKFRVNSPKL